MKYLVYIPIAGHCTVEVEADDEETAIATAWESIEDYGLRDDDIEWELYEKLAEGNVMHVSEPTSITVVKQDD